MQRAVRRVLLQPKSFRAFSDVATVSPAATIAKNVAVMEAAGAAKDDAALAAALNATAAVEGGASVTSAGGKFEPDPTAWQNMSFGDYVATEAGREHTLPFVIGGIVTFMLLGMGLPAMLPAGTPENSKYIALSKGVH